MNNQDQKYTQVNDLVEQIRKIILEISSQPIGSNYEGSNPDDPKRDIFDFNQQYINQYFPDKNSLIIKLY
ncbi:TPA: hypothetical protein JI414_RS19455, partial [Acinetobacter baumannii]|nr:hypothetical protein [Acinetobacter baumannii]